MKNNTQGFQRKAGAALVGVLTLLAVLIPIQSTSAVALAGTTVPAGTSMRIRVQTEIRSTRVSAGDPFQATVVSPVVVDREELIPAGTLVIGQVASVEATRAWGSPSGVVLKILSLRSASGVDVGVDGQLTDARGNRLFTVENLTAGTEIIFELTRTVELPRNFNGSSQSDYLDQRDFVILVQDVLQDLGYYTGRLDGQLSRPTRQAIAAFQRDQNMQATGILDRDTVARLGLIDSGNQQPIAVTAISADASIAGRDEMNVRIITRNTSSVVLTQEHFRQRDTMHIFVRGFKAQFITNRGTNELNVKFSRQEWNGLNRIVVHSAGNDIVISSNEIGGSGGALTADEAAKLEKDLSTTLASYARAIRVKYVPLTGQLYFTRANYRENEIELLFALNSVASNSRLYTQLLRNSDDKQAIAGATDLLVQQAKLVQRVLDRTRSNNAQIVARQWNDLRDTFAEMAQGGDVNIQGTLDQ